MERLPAGTPLVRICRVSKWQYRERKLAAGIPDSDFTGRHLKRGR